MPGLIVIFFGIGALIVACLQWVGLIPGLKESFIVWTGTSVVLLLAVRHFILKWFPAESSVQTTDEDLEAVGTIVEIIEPGRIRYGGTSWPAVTKEGLPISEGRKARLLYRDNLVWVVEPYLELEETKQTE